MVNRFLTPIWDELFPQYCYFCGLRSHRAVPLCMACQSDLQPNQTSCSRCALPLTPSPENLTHRVCGQCLQAPPDFDRVIAPWIYDEQMAFLIHRWKFLKDRRITSLLAYLWLEQYKEHHAPPDLLIPVPLHWQKLWLRGFNQSQLLCQELRRQDSALRSAQMGSRWVQRHRATSAQSGLGARERRYNLLGAFTARRRCDNLRVAIIDDVLTTGATASVMATTLRDAGAQHIEIWCIARTPNPQD